MGTFQQVFGFSSSDDGAPEPALPPWLGPPEGELGVVVPQSTVIASSARGVVALRGVVAYSTGVSLELVALARELSRSETSRLFHEQHQIEPDDLPDGFLRLGVELSDGTRASNLAGHRAAYARKPDDEPAGPVLLPRGGGGGNGGRDRVSMQNNYWLWPLPPQGPLRISCEWPIVDIPLSTIEIDADALRAAAAKSVQLFG